MAGQDELYKEAGVTYGPALRRLARSYEADPEQRQDLLQEIHIELWRSLRLFDGRCGLRTWVYRVAHNVAASHILRQRRLAGRLVSLESLETEPGFVDGEAQAQQQRSISRLLDQIYSLLPLDRQVLLLYLEGETATLIAEVTGLSASHVATKIHRLKKLLRRESGEGVFHAEG